MVQKRPTWQELSLLRWQSLEKSLLTALLFPVKVAHAMKTSPAIPLGIVIVKPRKRLIRTEYLQARNTILHVIVYARSNYQLQFRN